MGFNDDFDTKLNMNLELVWFLILKHGIAHWTDLYLITHAYKFFKLPDRIQTFYYYPSAKVVNRPGFYEPTLQWSPYT